MESTNAWLNTKSPTEPKTSVVSQEDFLENTDLEVKTIKTTSVAAAASSEDRFSASALPVFSSLSASSDDSQTTFSLSRVSIAPPFTSGSHFPIASHSKISLEPLASGFAEPLPEDADFAMLKNHLFMKAFTLDKEKKLLLVPEAHGSRESMLVREYVRTNRIFSFSEGESDRRGLDVIEGIEKEADYKPALLLKYLLNDDPNREMPDGSIRNEHEFIQEARRIGISERKQQEMLEASRQVVTPQQKNELITYYQMHERDKLFAKKIAKKCALLEKNRTHSLGIAFFGAAHILSGFDGPDECRTTDARIPDLLISQEKGTNLGYYIQLHNVHVYIYPKALTINTPGARNYIKEILEQQ